MFKRYSPKERQNKDVIKYVIIDYLENKEL